MRLEKITVVLRLARALAGSSQGMTLDEIAAFADVSRRTAERIRDAIEQSFGVLERVEDGRRTRFRLAAQGLGQFAVAPTTLELTELENAARSHEARQDLYRAEVLRNLDLKIRASLREGPRRRLDVDVDAQLSVEALARQVGPRPLTDPIILGILREALLVGRTVTFKYREGEVDQKRTYHVTAYGLLFAPRYYLVAASEGKTSPVLFRLDRISNLEITENIGIVPAAFDLASYASRSFGVFQEAPELVSFIFSKEAALDAKMFLFHPRQMVDVYGDGRVQVSFRAGGLLQIAQHLMTWGNTVTVICPERLKSILCDQIELLQKHHCRAA